MISGSYLLSAIKTVFITQNSICYVEASIFFPMASFRLTTNKLQGPMLLKSRHNGLAQEALPQTEKMRV